MVVIVYIIKEKVDIKDFINSYDYWWKGELKVLRQVGAEKCCSTKTFLFF